MYIVFTWNEIQELGWQASKVPVSHLAEDEGEYIIILFTRTLEEYCKELNQN